MSRNSKVGGTKRRVLDVVGFTAIIVFIPALYGTVHSGAVKLL